jgi:hypothetical protein
MGTLRITVLGIVFVVWLGPLLFVPLPIVVALIASAPLSIWRGRRFFRLGLRARLSAVDQGP